MDELLIDEKKYVSSKQAAKMTGYAKDYIGQLCREGRVPARLVGRSWYVLETAIQDHRFGTADIHQNKNVKKTTSAPALAETWESPRYEASSEEFLPSIHRSQDAKTVPDKEENVEEDKSQEHLQDSWRAWFDRVGDTVESNVPAVIAREPELEIEVEHTSEVSEPVEDTEVNVPIHAIYQTPPEELLPHRMEIEPAEQSFEEEEEPEERRWMRGAVQAISVIIAILTVAVAVVGSGYFDKYISSFSQVDIISGITIYKR